MRGGPTHLRTYLAATCVAAICLAALVLAGRALATPTVRLKAWPVPIPGFPHTGGSGPELIAQVPLVASLPGAPYASVRSISLEVGSAYRSHGQTIYYGRVPRRCPKGGLLMKTEVIFAQDGETSKPETVDASYAAPCPRR